MTLKKWRPFWSYDVEKTERFLSEMAADGKRLVDVNIWTRMFSFTDDNCERSSYQIMFDKHQKILPMHLENEGWETFLTKGNWMFISHDEEEIHAYPVRESLLKRNRLHSNILKIIAFFYCFQFFFPIMLMFVHLFSGEVDTFVRSSYWGITILYFVQVILVIWLAIHVHRKLRLFEQKYFNANLDEQQQAGRLIRRWRLGWISAPDLLEQWLGEMALNGYHLVSMKGARLTFEKGKAKRVSYVLDYQWHAAPHYFDVHKEAGWKLKHTSPFAIFKHTLWMKEYASDEEKPKLTYSSTEQKLLVRKIFYFNIGIAAYSLIMMLYAAWMTSLFLEGPGWRLWGMFMIVGLSLAAIQLVATITRALKYVFRMKASFVD